MQGRLGLGIKPKPRSKYRTYGLGSLSLTHGSHVMRWKARMNPSLAVHHLEF